MMGTGVQSESIWCWFKGNPVKEGSKGNPVKEGSKGNPVKEGSKGNLGFL
jgi:hypothetical protein